MADRQYGGFWRRFFAFLIDRVILYFASLVIFLIGLLAFGIEGEMIENALSSLEDTKSGIHIIALIYFAASILSGMTYFTLFHGIAGRTPGKMLFGLHVIQTSGDPITPGIAFLRWVGYLISALPFGFGFLWAAFDGRKQGWHDKIAATVVVRSKGLTVHDSSADAAHGVAESPPSEGQPFSASRPNTVQGEKYIPVTPENDGGLSREAQTPNPTEKWLDKQEHI